MTSRDLMYNETDVIMTSFSLR